MRVTKFLAAAVVLVAVVITAGFAAASISDDGYRVDLRMPSAAGIVIGSPVSIAGNDVGEIVGLKVNGDQAVVTITVDDQHAPLHAGSLATVEWRAVLGERTIAIRPASPNNPVVPTGGSIDARPQVSVQDLLETLDEPTRRRVSGLVKQLDSTLQGSESDVNKTIETAGPTMQAMSEVLGAIGKDGPAIRHLVTRLKDMSSVLASRDNKIANVVQDLGSLMDRVANEQMSLTEASKRLPRTLSETRKNLEKVPAAADEVEPLLDELEPVTARLKSVSGDLQPVLRDLRPTVHDLRPTLRSASGLLKHTPSFVDTASTTVSGLKRSFTRLTPALRFLRPYTPELAGWLANWNSVFGPYDSIGKYLHGSVETSALGPTALPGHGKLPGFEYVGEPMPGEIGGQPWKDAHGDGMK